jgi:hypothetical protein
MIYRIGEVVRSVRGIEVQLHLINVYYYTEKWTYN